MKNTDCIIYITTKRGRTWSYLKENDGWTQTGPTGTVHGLSAEQLLSHLLPPLAADHPGGLSVRVERKPEGGLPNPSIRSPRDARTARGEAPRRGDNSAV